MGCEWGAWCLGLWEGTGLVAWRAAAVARRLVGCRTAGLHQKQQQENKRLCGAVGFLLLCLLECRAGA